MLNVKWCTQIIHDRKLASQGRWEIICDQQWVEQCWSVVSLIDSFVRFLPTTIPFQTQQVRNIVWNGAEMKCYQSQCDQISDFPLMLSDATGLLPFRNGRRPPGKVPPGWCGEQRAFIICSSGRSKAGGLAVMAVPRLSTSCAGRRPAVGPVALKMPITLKQLEKWNPSSAADFTHWPSERRFSRSPFSCLSKSTTLHKGDNGEVFLVRWRLI